MSANTRFLQSVWALIKSTVHSETSTLTQHHTRSAGRWNRWLLALDAAPDMDVWTSPPPGGIIRLLVGDGVLMGVVKGDWYYCEFFPFRTEFKAFG